MIRITHESGSHHIACNHECLRWFLEERWKEAFYGPPGRSFPGIDGYRAVSGSVGNWALETLKRLGMVSAKAAGLPAELHNKRAMARAMEITAAEGCELLLASASGQLSAYACHAHTTQTPGGQQG